MQATSPPQSRTLFAIFVLGIVVSPWPLGSNRDWAWPLLSVLFLLVTLALIYKAPFSPLKHAKIVYGSFTALLAYILWQRFGIPGLHSPIGIDNFAIQNEFLKTLTYACFFFATVQFARSKDRVLILAYSVVLVGLAQALFGGMQQLVFDIARSRGSFPNPNHFAGYLEMALGLGIGLMLALSTNNDGKGFSLVDFLTGPLGRLRIIIIIMVIALVMSRSRMGNVAFFTGILVTASISFYYARSFNRYTAILLISILALDALIIGNYFGIERLEERFREATTQQSMRADIQTYNLRIFKDQPFTGSGAGTYEAVFPPYRDELVPKKAVHTENDFTELLLELGVIGVVPLIVILMTGLNAQVRLLAGSVPVFERGIAFGCLSGTLAILIHGIADVNLQIPSNALLFVLLLALPVAIVDSAGNSSPHATE